MAVGDEPGAGDRRAPLGDEEDRLRAAQRFRTIVECALARLQGLASPGGETAQAAVVTASRAAGFLEALNLLAPDVARIVSEDAERLADAVRIASAPLDTQLGHPSPTPW